jgi:hypothetical protein
LVDFLCSFAGFLHSKTPMSLGEGYD